MPFREADLSELVCPNCLQGPLLLTGAGVLCSRCGKRYDIDEGIPVFLERPATFDWGVPPERIEQALGEIGRLGWHDAVMRLYERLSPKQAEMFWLRALGLRRLALQMLLPVGRKARVLDFGTGWGTVALHLANFCGQVVAFDQVGLHLRWLRVACVARGIENVIPIQGGDTKHLPFPDESFDAVILNGVLEHVAVNTAGNPREVQQRFLKEVARILKPSGSVYIGIENRLNYKYFLGVREGHISMKYGALLPRVVTRWYLKWLRSRPYREYTYSLFGYRKLLARAGFRHWHFFAPWPTYSSAGEFFPVMETRRTRLWQVESRHPAANWPGWYFARAYSMTASREFPEPSLLERILREISLRAGGPSIWSLKGAVFKATSGGKAVVRIGWQDALDWHVQVGLTPLAGKRIAAQHRAMSVVHGLALPPDVKRRVPVSIMTGEVDGYVYAVREYRAGVNGGALVVRDEGRDTLCRDAEAFIGGLHEVGGRSIKVDEAEFQRLFGEPLAAVRQWFTAVEWECHEQWFVERTLWIKSLILGASLPVVPCHGDFVPENCICDESSGALSQVLDWELYDGAGLPMLDWVTFLGCAYRPKVKAEMWAHGEDPHQTKFHGYPFIFLEEPLLSVLHRYLDRLRVSWDLLLPLLFMWWVRQLSDWAPLLLYHPDWRRLRVFPVIERWSRVLEGKSSG